MYIKLEATLDFPYVQDREIPIWVSILADRNAADNFDSGGWILEKMSYLNPVPENL